MAAAIRVMTRDGVAKATTRAIASEAEMPLGVFHYAFRSKQELMTMVTETIARQSKAEIDAAVLGDEPPELLDLIVAGLCAYFDHVVEHPHEHGEACGHPAVPHGDHVDYVHDGHRHAVHGEHYDEH